MVFLGFSGNAHATPFSISDHLGKGISSLTWHGGQSDFGGDHSAGQSNGRGSFYDQIGRMHVNAGSRNFPTWSFNQEPILCTLPVIGQVTTPADVPEGGMTVLMVGMALIGVVVMRKKQNA